MDRRYFEHYVPGEPARLDRRYCCECCGYPTLDLPGNYEFCQICRWMDDGCGQGGPAKETLAEARENFRRYLTRRTPGSMGFNAQELEKERGPKLELMAAYDAYMNEADLHRRTSLWVKVRRLSDNFPFGDPDRKT